ncbi:response regulator [Chryseolinea sp. T2]|uniref:LytR/AlgR family response regulator transcription factor n=1 Tax=Chryseolinea sp. T2 TaxID=3129255 RepID=UPI0030772A4A
MNKFKVIITDDEPAAREGLTTLLAPDHSIEILQACSNGLEAIQAINEHKPDILLLDIQMPGVNGFDVINNIKEHIPQIIFITAYDQYAIQAFENFALDYLLKPFSDERFFRSLERAKEIVRNKESAKRMEALRNLIASTALDNNDKLFDSSYSRTESDKLIVKTGGKVLFIPWKEISHVEADDYVIRVYYGDKLAVIRESMKAMEQLLPVRSFIRTHKSFIVNIDQVSTVETGSRGMTIRLINKKEIPVSKSYRDDVQKHLGIR